jgi:hypothetical protein
VSISAWLQEDSLDRGRREFLWMAKQDRVNRSEGVPPRPYILDRGAVHVI